MPAVLWLCRSRADREKMPLRQRRGIFFAAIFCVALQGGSLALAACPPQGSLSAARVAAVTDGDTLRLDDGRRLRLLGINAPELARDGRPPQPLAEAAQRRAAALLGKHRQLYLHSHGVDRYGRLLAEVYLRPDGGHLGEALLAEGLAWHIVVPPQSRGDDCLQAAEAEARRRRLGLWALPPLAAERASAADQGFALLRGVVESVSHSRNAVWVDLRGQVVLRIDHRDLPNFTEQDWSQWPGRRIEVRGWLRSRRAKAGFAPLKMDLRHPAMMRWTAAELPGDRH